MNKNIPLMLDTTVFKQVPKMNSQLFKELIKYTRLGIFNLHISEVIEQEFLTWIKAEAQDAFVKIVKSTESLNKYYDKPSIMGMILDFNSTASVAESQINYVLKMVVNNWEDFKRKTNATILPIGENHGKLVMNSYFRGDMPFRKIKYRDDIPDAFIYYSLVDLLKENENVLFVSNDSRFINRIESDNLICFSNLSELFSSNDYKFDDRYFNSLEEDSKVITTIKLFEEDIHRKLKHQIEFSEFAGEVEEKLKDNVIGEYVSISTDTVNLDIDIKNIKNISELSYLISFSTDLTHSITSAASKDALKDIGDQRLRKIEQNVKDDGELELHESYNSKVQGNFSITFDNLSPLMWKEKKNSDHFWLKPYIKEISISLEDIKTIDK